MTEDRASFLKLAHGLYDAALPALKAIDAKNAERSLDAGEGIDTIDPYFLLSTFYFLLFRRGTIVARFASSSRTAFLSPGYQYSRWQFSHALSSSLPTWNN